MTMSGLFDNLPEFPVALPNDELALLARLPEWPTSTEVDDEEQAACRRLEKRGLVKLHRWKDDPMAIRRTWYAGKLPTAMPRAADAEIVGSNKCE